MAFDWAAFETELRDELLRALRRVGRAQRGDRFYALALHGLYRELDRTIALPILALAIERGAVDDDDDDFWGARWNPPDWALPEIDLRARPGLRLQRALDAEATRGTQAHFGRVEARYVRTLVRVVRHLRDVAASYLAVTDDFVAYVFDPEGGSELAAKTIPKRRFARLFARQVALDHEVTALATLPARERAAFLVTRFAHYEGVSTEMAQRELVAMGDAAVPALLTVVADATNGWTAAKVLGQIGVSTPDVLDALRRRAPQSFWHAMALGMLGDDAWLSTQKPEVAVPGLCARHKAITGAYRPLDYGPLEHYLDAATAPAHARVAEELAPGSSYSGIELRDVDEAIRGLSSPHAVVRWHAASVLGDRGLGPAAGKRIQPALAASLGDPHPFVRRIAALSLSYWRGAIQRYRAALAALLDDPDETVRRIAAHVLR